MADSNSGASNSNGSRRNFLKVGAGVVAGAVVAGVGVAAYENSVIGSNNSSSSSTVQSLTNELNSTQSALSDAQNSLTAANGTISSLNSQLTSTQGQLSTAQSSLSAATSQNASLNSQLTATQGSLSSANGQVSTLQGQVTSLNSALTSAQGQASTLQASVDNLTAYQILTPDEVTLVNAIASTIIPTDSNGPGGTEAGCSYFIDGQLAGKYGVSGHMYMQGPFIQHDLTTAVTPNVAPRTYTAANGNVYTVGNNATYSAGTMKTVPDNGMRYQYNFNLRYFWHLGLQALESYAKSAYGGNFETLSAANQLKCLQDIANNVPTQAAFNDILPADFFYEIFFMVYSGFTTDPMYGGNRGMAGWILTANNGVNMGNFYGEGYTTKQIMVSSTPPILKPASLGQYQKGSP